MYIFSNALKNIGRNRGRNILVGLVLFAIIATTVISLVISSTAAAIIDDYRTRLGSEVFISPDIERIRAEGRLMEFQFFRQRRTIDQYEAFANSEHLLGYTITAVMESVLTSLTAIDEAGLADFAIVGDVAADTMWRFATNRLIATSDTVTLTEFIDGTRQIIEGEMFRNAGEAIVSSEFAELNQLEIGDMVEVISRSPQLEGIVQMTVTGIFFDTTDEYDPAMLPLLTAGGFPVLNRRNEILTSYETLRGFPQFASMLEVEASFFLRSPEYLPEFEAYVRALGLSYDYMVTVDDVTFNAIVGPVEGLRSISITFMFVVLALGAIILILLSSIAIRERKYEIGVLRAMGMKKGKVARGLIYEMTALTAICLVLGLGLGTVTVQPIADILLQQQIAAIESTRQDNMPNMGGGMLIGGGMVMHDPGVAGTQLDTEPLSEINISLGLDVIGQIALISLLLALVTSMAGVARITKYEPIKILMERN